VSVLKFQFSPFPTKIFFFLFFFFFFFFFSKKKKTKKNKQKNSARFPASFPAISRPFSPIFRPFLYKNRPIFVISGVNFPHFGHLRVYFDPFARAEDPQPRARELAVGVGGEGDAPQGQVAGGAGI
jgi:hypothetical protein